MSRRTASSSLRALLFAAAIALVPLALAGCFGGVNDICQVPTDCNTGLVCCKHGTIDTRGVCQAPTTLCVVLGTDAGPLPDLGPRDFGTDTGSDAAVDAGPDAGSDAGGTDAGGDASTDGGPLDSGAADTGTDAGDVDAGDVDAGDPDAGLDAG